jgi:hypothetical protein
VSARHYRPQSERDLSLGERRELRAVAALLGVAAELIERPDQAAAF